MFDFYPDKPILEEAPKKKNGFLITLGSVLLFILTFSIVFPQEINFIIFLVVVLLIHELGHFLMMKRFGYQNVRMLFVPLMGAFVQGKKKSYSQRESLLVVGSGPLPGVFIGVVLLYLAYYFEIGNLIELSALFLFLNILNLFPIDPLDGGQIFRLLLYQRNEKFLMIFAFVSSLLIIMSGWWLDSLLVMGFGFFLGIRVRNMQKNIRVHAELKAENVNYFCTYEELSNEDYAKIRTLVIQNSKAIRTIQEGTDDAEFEQIVAGQVNQILVEPLIKDASMIFKVFFIFLWITAILSPLILFLTLNLKQIVDVVSAQ